MKKVVFEFETEKQAKDFFNQFTDAFPVEQEAKKEIEVTVAVNTIMFNSKVESVYTQTGSEQYTIICQ